MKGRLLPLLFICMLGACSGDKVPAGVLPAEKMTDVLIDIHLAEAAITTQQIYGDPANRLAAQYYSHVFRKHGISREEFKESFDFYSAHPELYKKLYDGLIARMTRDEPELKKSLKDLLPRPDSLQIAPGSGGRGPFPVPATIDSTGTLKGVKVHSPDR